MGVLSACFIRVRIRNRCPSGRTSWTTWSLNDTGGRGECLEKLNRPPNVKIGADRHRRSHHLAVRRKVKQLFAIASPPGLLTSPSRDLPPATRLWERGHVNLPFPSLIGGVGYPFFVGRELRIPDSGRNFQKQTSSKLWEDNVLEAAVADRVQNVSCVPRPVVGKLVGLIAHEALLFLRAILILNKQVDT